MKRSFCVQETTSVRLTGFLFDAYRCFSYLKTSIFKDLKEQILADKLTSEL